MLIVYNFFPLFPKMHHSFLGVVSVIYVETAPTFSFLPLPAFPASSLGLCYKALDHLFIICSGSILFFSDLS